MHFLVSSRQNYIIISVTSGRFLLHVTSNEARRGCLLPWPHQFQAPTTSNTTSQLPQSMCTHIYTFCVTCIMDSAWGVLKSGGFELRLYNSPGVIKVASWQEGLRISFVLLRHLLAKNHFWGWWGNGIGNYSPLSTSSKG